MKQNELIKMGFKRVEFDNHYWHELQFQEHVFLTNDAPIIEKDAEWFVGYSLPNADTFWFNENLKSSGEFKIIFRVLTGVELKLIAQKKRLTPVK